MKLSADELEEIRKKLPLISVTQEKTNLNNYKLNSKNPEHWYFRLTITFFLFIALFIFIGVVLGIFCYYIDDLFGKLISGFLSVAFLGIFTALLITQCRKNPHFDFTREIFWKGWRNNSPTGTKSAEITQFQEIAGLQMIREVCGFHNLNGKKVPIESYELNLVKNDRSRIHIIDDGSLELIYRAGNAIAQRLEIPFWDERDVFEPGEKFIPGKSIQTRAITMTLGMGLMLICGYTFLSMFMLPYLEYQNVSTYLETPAVITVSDLKIDHSSKGKTHRVIDFSYRYQNNGLHYSSNRYDVCGKIKLTERSKLQKKFISQYPVGKKIICFVNPDNPTQAVISKSFDFVRADVICGLICGFSTLVGMCLFSWGIFARRNKKIIL